MALTGISGGTALSGDASLLTNNPVAGQEKSSNAPPAPYVPVTRDWIAPLGQDNSVSSLATNWSPTGTPQPGDALTMHNGTMSVIGPGLVGDTLSLGVAGQTTTTQFNLATNLGMNLQTVAGSHDTLFVYSTGSNHDINLTADDADVNFRLVSSDGLNNSGDLTSDIFNLTNSTLDVSQGSSMLNTGELNLTQSAGFIHNNLEGTGKIVLAAGSGTASKLEFGASVSSGQSIEVDGDVTSKTASSLVVDHPDAFNGNVDLQYGHVDLHLATIADSYSFANDMMNIYANGTVIDTLSVHSPASYQGTGLNLTVSQTAFGVVVDNSGLSSPGSAILPIHI